MLLSELENEPRKGENVDGDVAKSCTLDKVAAVAAGRCFLPNIRHAMHVPHTHTHIHTDIHLSVGTPGESLVCVLSSCFLNITWPDFLSSHFERFVFCWKTFQKQQKKTTHSHVYRTIWRGQMQIP